MNRTEQQAALGAGSGGVDADLVLVSWNGQEPPLRCIVQDSRPRFEWLVLDYSNGDAQRQAARLHAQVPEAGLLSVRTECKGDIYQALAAHLQATGRRPRFVGMLDDDVLLGVGDINRLLHIGAVHGLHAFSASLSHDSVYSHRFMLHQPHRILRAVDWIEVMMPFYDGALFAAAAPHFGDNVSSWGIDRYLMPTLGQLTGLTRTMVVDAVMAGHVRPVTSGAKPFRNGLTAAQEAEAMKLRCLALIDQRQPALRGTPWFSRIFERRHSYGTRAEQLRRGLGRPIRRWLDGST